MSELRLDRGAVTLAGTSCGGGPPALLLHAGGERRQVWEPVAAELAREGFHSIAYDLRGHGESGGRAEALPPVAADVATMIRALDVAPVVVGSSLGGLAALLALAADDVRERVAGLVLVDVVPDPPARRTRDWLGRFAGDLASMPLVDDVLARAPVLREAARRLDLPVLLVRGGEGCAVTDEDLERFLGAAAHAAIAGVPEAGHLVARDAPVALAHHVAAHLRDAGVRRRRAMRFLVAAGAGEAAHPGGTLLAHHVRTGEALERWGAADWIVDAGRLHAAYGTDGHPEPMPNATPATVEAVVGNRAEALVAAYGACDRRLSYPTFLSKRPRIVDRHTGAEREMSPEELRAFAELTVANELDVFAHSPELARRHAAATAALFDRWSPLLGEPARAAVRSMRAR